MSANSRSLTNQRSKSPNGRRSTVKDDAKVVEAKQVRAPKPAKIAVHSTARLAEKKDSSTNLKASAADARKSERCLPGPTRLQHPKHQDQTQKRENTTSLVC